MVKQVTLTILKKSRSITQRRKSMNRQEVQIHVTGRHVSVTDAMKEYACKKLESIDMDYPKAIDAHVILDVEKYRHWCEIVLVCTNHIRIEVREESDDMYASIDLCMSKLARRMRKFKTKIQRHARRSKEETMAIKYRTIPSQSAQISSLES